MRAWGQSCLTRMRSAATYSLWPSCATWQVRAFTVQHGAHPQLQVATDAALTLSHNLTGANSAACTFVGSKRVELHQAGKWPT